MMRPRPIDSGVTKILEGCGIDRYFCDYEDDITYVDDLRLLGQRLGMEWNSLTETGVYQGYWFRQLGV